MSTPPPFEIRSSYASGVLVVGVRGEIDMATAPELGEAVGSASEDTPRVVVDLTEVTFLDSSALSSLVHSRRELEGRGIDFRVVSPRDQMVRRVLEITKLTAELGVVDSLGDALE